MTHGGKFEKDPKPEDASFDPQGKWDQAAIGRALDAYRESTAGREILFESVWLLVKAEVMLNLRAELKNDAAIDRAEFAACRELHLRLERGRIKFLSKTYLKRFICSTAIRFARTSLARMVPLETTDSQTPELESLIQGPQEREWIRYADLYFCLGKLSDDENRLLKLHHAQGLSLDDTAEKLNIRYEAARKRHSRALRKLRLCLENARSGGWS